MKFRTFLFLSLAVLFSSLAEAATIYVDGGATCPGSGTEANPFCKIQDSINAAITGDEVLVHNGTYVENINFLNKAITVRSKNGPDVTIIEVNIIDSVGVIKFISGETSSSVLDGFTIQNGGSNLGGGIFCDNSSPSITNCTISGNRGNYGGGIYCNRSSSPTINNCTITDNSAEERGGGIYCENSSPTITLTVPSAVTRLHMQGGGFTENPLHTSSPTALSAATQVVSAGGFIYTMKTLTPSPVSPTQR